MAEAEDVISDLARHVTVRALRWWHRHHPPPSSPGRVELSTVAARLDLLAHATFGTRYPLRPTQMPAPSTLLGRLFGKNERLSQGRPLPATDDRQLWLPPHLDAGEPATTLLCYRAMALQQAMRASRGSARGLAVLSTAVERSLYHLLEAWAADHALSQRLPGLIPALAAIRQFALRLRPPLAAFPPQRQPVERLLRQLLAAPPAVALADVPVAPDWSASVEMARAWAIRTTFAPSRNSTRPLLLADEWTGELLSPGCIAATTIAPAEHEEGSGPSPRSSRLLRRPQVRTASSDEDDADVGAWMMQTSTPHEHAEDPIGLQRPVDREDGAPASDFADSVAELEQARLLATPGRPREVLLSDDPPASVAWCQPGKRQASQALSYPEWDYREQRYRQPGAFVWITPPSLGDAEWMLRVMARRRPQIEHIRRQFAQLRASRKRLYRQFDGDEVDLASYLDALADARSGQPMSQAVFELQRTQRRDLRVLLLVDASGSMDSWLASDQRLIDVAREALLLVCLALEALGEPYSVWSFSGESASQVSLRPLKPFRTPFGPETGQRIAGLEPDRYTRAGAAVRHACAELMQEPATHRLLLLLSDGKPNDQDQYAGRYGIEDTRQSILEARRQGVQPFCLTIDRQAADYLPYLFGNRHYAMLANPSLLPSVLVDWLKRLLR